VGVCVGGLWGCNITPLNKITYDYEGKKWKLLIVADKE
jgi:hypothetical protein